MAPLVPCPECNRHFRPAETACPFCNADVRDAIANLRPRAIPTERLGRTALMAFAAANMGVAACGGEVSGPSPGPETGGFIGQPHYGAPPPPTGGAGGSSSMTGGAPNTGGVIIVPPYGTPPPYPPGTGGDFGMAEYGAPPPPNGTGGDFGAAIYGAAPPPLPKPQK